MLNAIKGFARDEDGLEMVEWAAMAALITGAAVTAMGSLGSALATKLDDIATLIAP